jgi:hypothetical protein
MLLLLLIITIIIVIIIIIIIIIIIYDNSWTQFLLSPEICAHLLLYVTIFCDKKSSKKLKNEHFIHHFTLLPVAFPTVYVLDRKCATINWHMHFKNNTLRSTGI